MVIKVAWPATSPAKKKQGLQPRKRSRDMSAEAQVPVSVQIKNPMNIPRFSMVILPYSCEYHVWIFGGDS